MANVSKIQAILHAKCPRCREGDMFMYPLTKNLSKFMDMHKHCPKCGLKFEVEPGFFYGAMYIGYAFSVAILVTIGVATHIIGNKPPIVYYMVNITAVLLFFSPIAFRYARVLLLYLFGGVRFKEE